MLMNDFSLKQKGQGKHSNKVKFIKNKLIRMKHIKCQTSFNGDSPELFRLSNRKRFGNSKWIYRFLPKIVCGYQRMALGLQPGERFVQKLNQCLKQHWNMNFIFKTTLNQVTCSSPLSKSTCWRWKNILWEGYFAKLSWFDQKTAKPVLAKYTR